MSVDFGQAPLRILIVDDNEDSGKTLGWTVEMLGHVAQVANGGDQAIKMATSNPPDIILLDIGMPVMNGYEVCIRLKQQSSLDKTLFVAQTGWGQEEDRRKSESAGFDYHLVKPVQMDDLLKVIKLKNVI